MGAGAKVDLSEVVAGDQSLKKWVQWLSALSDLTAI